MKPNPRPHLGAHAPLELPDIGEISNSALWNGHDPRGEIHEINEDKLETLLWMAEHFWSLLEEIQELEDVDCDFYNEEAEKEAWKAGYRQGLRDIH